MLICCPYLIMNVIESCQNSQNKIHVPYWNIIKINTWNLNVLSYHGTNILVEHAVDIKYVYNSDQNTQYKKCDEEPVVRN